MNQVNHHRGIPGINASLWALVLLLGLFILPSSSRAQNGTSISNAIPAGTFGCGGAPFVSSRNNNTYGGVTYANNYNTTSYPGSNAQASKDVWYQVIISKTTNLTLSLCGSSFDTYLHLLNSSGGRIASNDDSDCGLPSYIFQSNLTAGTYYVVVEGYQSSTGNFSLSISSSGSPSPGATISNAINVGNLNSLLSYTDNRSNADVCLGNEYTQNSSNDIVYQFSLSSQTTVTFSHCGSGFDTFMWLLNSSGSVIASNDDNGSGSSPCPGTQAYMQVNLSAGSYYLVSEGYGGYTGNILTSISVPGGGSSNCTSLASSLSQDQNYIATYSPRIELTDAGQLGNQSVCDVNQMVQYFDGLGRPLQTVQTKASPEKDKDIVLPVEYDEYGREARKYLAYASTSNNGSYKADALTRVTDYYYNNGSPLSGQFYSFNTPFSQTVFEPSPLNRVLEQGAPGASWQPRSSGGRTVVSEQGANTDQSGQYWVKRYSAVSPSGNHIRALQDDGLYGANQLYLSITKDENWTSGKARTTEEYKDKEGRVVLKRTWQDESTRLSTYYVYDDFDNLSYVLSPKAEGDNGSIDQTKLNDLCYQYYYDHRNRLIEKKIPGKGWEYVIYNKLDQVVFTQDALQRSNSHWIFSKYDGLGRIAMTGVYSRNIGRADLQSELDNHLNAAPSNKFWESTEGTSTGYSNNSFPQSAIAYYQSINYYGSYSIPGFSGSVTPSQTVTSRLNGLLTGTRTYLTDGSASYLSINYYDEYGKVIENVAENHIGGTDRVVNTYNNITGDVLSSTRTHISSYDQVTIANAFGYDHMGRRKYVKQNINNNSPMVIASFDYTETGQLLTKNLGNTADYNSTSFSTGNFMQNVGHQYNERGWLKRSASGFFDMVLNYQENGGNQFNGNISAQNWGTLNNRNKNYSYIYDALNRLTIGSSDQGYGESITSYDKNGNINQLIRTGSRSATQGYTYEGNKLTYLNGALMQYNDNNGNLTSDGTRGIGLSYNYLNLPKNITGNKTITYTYDATGRKLQKVSNISGTTDYVNGIHYKNISGIYQIEYVQTEEGRALKNGSNNQGNAGYGYQFTLKDHLGNSRVTFYRNPATQNVEALEATDYYPFGLATIDPSGKQNKYLYNGKENQEELEELDYHARFYDPVIGRFTTIDPSADEEDQESWSPYHYVYNNPIKNIDPDGRIPIETIWDVGNVLYDVGAAVVNHVKGNHSAATSNWIDAGLDLAAVALPYVPAGASKLVKGGTAAAKALDKGVDATKAKNLAEAGAKGIPKNQLGPSGKPKIHSVEKPNLKSAKDAARNNPKSNTAPAKHSSDKGQKTHYHSTKDGKKLDGKDNIHYVDKSSKKNKE